MTVFYEYAAGIRTGEGLMMAGNRFALSLHQLTALDASPARLVELAADVRCEHVCLFTFVPEAARGRYPEVRAADAAELRARLADAGVSVCNLEVFPLDGSEDRDAFARALDVGAGLGATRATAHVHGTSGRDEAADRFGAFCDLAAGYGIVAGLEFMSFSAIHDIGMAAQVVRAAGRGSIACDALHLFRNGGTCADVANHADLIGYAQLCDGPLDRPREEWWAEAVRSRDLPGAGELPLVQMVQALREGTVIEVEVPRAQDAKAGMPDIERVRRAVAATRQVLEHARKIG